jgi:DNA-binding XRE family transcriptional regulator
MSRTLDPDRNARAQAFGENLRNARRRAELSQEELAGHADVDRAAISTYEHGGREPNLRTIVNLARTHSEFRSAIWCKDFERRAARRRHPTSGRAARRAVPNRGSTPSSGSPGRSKTRPPHCCPTAIEASSHSTVSRFLGGTHEQPPQENQSPAMSRAKPYGSELSSDMEYTFQTPNSTRTGM